MPVNNISLTAPTDYALEQAKVMRQQKLADALREQAMQVSGTEYAPGGYAVKQSPLQGISKLAQAFASSQIQKRSDDRLTELATKQRGDQSADMSSIVAALQGTPASTSPQQGPTQDGQPLPDINIPAQPGSLSNLDPSSLRTPEARQMIVQMMMKQAEKGMESPFGKVDAKDFTSESLAKFAATRNPSDLVPVRKQEAVTAAGANGAPETRFVDPYAPQAPIAQPVRPESVETAGANGAPQTSFVNPYTSPAQPKPIKNDMVQLGNVVQPINPYAQINPLPVGVSPNTVYAQNQENARFGGVSGNTAASNAVSVRGQNMANDPSLQGRIAESRGAGTATGTATAQAAMDLPAATAKAEQAVQLVDQMVGSPDGKSKPHPGFQDVVGATWKPGARFVPGTNAAGFQALLDQVKGGAFMQAYDTLKGGGQITEVEGAKATSAITRMNTAQSENEFTAAAREFQDVIRAGVQRARRKAAGRRASDAPGGVIDFNELPSGKP